MHARLSRTDRIPKEWLVGQCHAAASGKGEAEPQRRLVGTIVETARIYYRKMQMAVASYQSQLIGVLTDFIKRQSTEVCTESPGG